MDSDRWRVRETAHFAFHYLPNSYAADHLTLLTKRAERIWQQLRALVGPDVVSTPQVTVYLDFVVAHPERRGEYLTRGAYSVPEQGAVWAACRPESPAEGFEETIARLLFFEPRAPAAGQVPFLCAGEFDRPELRRRLVPVQARLGHLLGRGQEGPDRKAAALCRELDKWWAALRTFARVEGIEPTNNVSEHALRPAVLWRKGSFGSDSETGSRFAERLLTVVATCRQQGRPLLEFLVAASGAVPRGSPAPLLLPERQGI